MNPTWLLVWSACRNDPPPVMEGPCEASNTVAGATQYGVRIQQAGCGELTLEGYEVLGDGALRVDLFADGSRILPRITADEDGAVFRGLHMHGPFTLAGDGPLAIWRQGHGSSSPSGVFVAGELTLDADGLPVADQQATSSWAGLVGRQDGSSVLIGVHAARITRFEVGFDAAGVVHALWGGRGETLSMDAGDTMYLDPLFTGIGPAPQALWDSWADGVAAAAEVTLAEIPPTTWLAYADAELLAENLPALAAAGIGAVQLQGWELSTTLPAGTAGAAADIAAAGATPVLWMSPFVVSPSAPVYAAHPDWWVRDPDGSEVAWGDDVVLDVTRPEAAAWLEDVVVARVTEGWRGFVFDRLDAGAVEGLRGEPVTGTAAYGLGMDLLRRAAGAATITAVDAPFLPSVGKVDVYRVAADGRGHSAGDWRGWVRPEVRSTAARGFTNGRWWWVDPGPLGLRDWLPWDEVGPVVAVAVSGGVWVLNDAPADLDPLVVNPELVDAVGVRVTPDDPLAAAAIWDDPEGPVPVRWTFEDGRTALLNLSEATITVDGPGGTELLTGATAEPGPRMLEAGSGEIWH